MSPSLIKVISPPSTRAPRGADWAASCAVWLGRVLSARETPARQPATPALDSAQAVLGRQ